MKCKFNFVIVALLALLAPVTALAEPITVYLLKSSTSWNACYLYSWNSNQKFTGEWTSSKKLDDADNTRTIGGETFWYYTFDESVSSVNIIFKDSNNNAPSNRTSDITGINSSTAYKLDNPTGTSGASKYAVTIAAPTIDCTDNTVSISCSEDGAEIYYTLDGSQVTKNSLRYTGPFSISGNEPIRAKAYKYDFSSDIVSLNYTPEENYVYVTKSSVDKFSWGKCKAYAYYNNQNNDKQEPFGSWSGTEMTLTTINGIEYYCTTDITKYLEDSKSSSIELIFTNGGSGTNQTDHFTVTGTAAYNLTAGSSNRGVSEIEDFLKPAAPVIEKTGNTISISTTSTSCEIYYTIDGGERIPYTEPFTLDNDAEIEAVAVRGNYESDATSYSFIWHYVADEPSEKYIYYPVAVDSDAKICAADTYLPLNGGQRTKETSLDELYIIGSSLKDAEGNTHDWLTNADLIASDYRYGDIFVFENVTIDSYFSFSKVKTSEWETVNKDSNRFGPGSDGYKVAVESETTLYNSIYNSWTADKGTYRVIVNLATNKLLLTQTAAPSYNDMTKTGAEDLVSYDGKDLYRIALTSDFAGKLIALKSGNTAVDATPATALSTDNSYIFNGTQLVPCDYVAAKIASTTAHVHDGNTTIHVTEETENLAVACSTTTSASDYDILPINNGEATLGENDGIAENTQFYLNWKVQNAQGLWYYGSEQMTYHPEAAAKVEIYCYADQSWGVAHYKFVSAYGDQEPLEGDFSNTWAGCITVPAEYLFSHVTISNIPTEPTEAAPASSRRKADTDADADDNTNTVVQSIEFDLAGATQYFIVNHMVDQTEGENFVSGVCDIEAADEQAPVEYFNLQGIRVDNPCNGIYIRRQGSTITKIAL